MVGLNGGVGLFSTLLINGKNADLGQIAWHARLGHRATEPTGGWDVAHPSVVHDHAMAAESPG